MSESIVFDVGASRKKKDDLSSGLLDKSLATIIAEGKQSKRQNKSKDQKIKKVSKEITKNLSKPKNPTPKQRNEKLKRNKEIVIKKTFENDKLRQPVAKKSGPIVVKKKESPNVTVTTSFQKSFNQDRIIEKKNNSFKKKFEEQKVRINIRNPERHIAGSKSNDHNTERRVTVSNPRIEVKKKTGSHSDQSKTLSISDRFGQRR